MVQYRSSEISSSKFYTINGRSVHCITYVNKNEQGYRSYGMSNETLCKAIKSMGIKASYNESRMEKLQGEYICAKGYYSYSGRGDNDHRPIPNCYSDIHNEFKPLFNEAVRAVKRISDTIDTERYHTNEIRNLAEEANHAIERVKDFVYLHPEVNNAFEQALYDTNGAGIAGLLAMIVPPLGMLAFAANSVMNNEFDGKISRAYDDAHEVLVQLHTVEAELGYH